MVSDLGNPCFDRYECLTRTLINMQISSWFVLRCVFCVFTILPLQCWATTWIVLPKDYEEAGAPQEFVVDSAGRPHILFFNQRAHAYHEIPLEEPEDIPLVLQHAVRLNGHWKVAPLPFNLENFGAISLAANPDSGGVTYFALRRGEPQLMLLEWRENGWSEKSTVELPTKSPSFIETQYDNEGKLHLLLTEGLTGKIWYGESFENKPFSFAQVEIPKSLEIFEEDVGEYYLTEFESVSDGAIEIIFSQGFEPLDLNPLYRLQKDGEGWKTIEKYGVLDHMGRSENPDADLGLPDGWFRSAKSGESRMLAIGGLSDLYYYEKKGEGPWQWSLIDPTIYSLHSLLFDGSGAPVILYGQSRGDFERESIMTVARRSGDGHWKFEPVALRSIQSKMAKTPDGEFMIAFNDLDALYLAEKRNGRWERDMIAGGGLGGGKVTDLLEYKGVVHAFIEAREGLFLLQQENGTWTRSLIDPLGHGGRILRICEDHIVFAYWKANDDFSILQTAWIYPSGSLVVHPIDVTSREKLITPPDRKQLINDLNCEDTFWSIDLLTFSEDTVQQYMDETYLSMKEESLNIGAIVSNTSFSNGKLITASSGDLGLTESFYIWGNDDKSALIYYEYNRSNPFEEGIDPARWRIRSLEINGFNYEKGVQVVELSRAEFAVVAITRDDKLVLARGSRYSSDELTYETLSTEGYGTYELALGYSYDYFDEEMDDRKAYEARSEESKRHLVIVTAGKEGLAVWLKKDGVWQKEIVDKPIGFVINPQIDVKEDGTMYLGYYNAYTNGSYLATKSPGGVWQKELMPTIEDN